MDEIKVFSVVVSGRVQRVGYRNWALKTALDIEVYGWVKNLPDGKVELLIFGDKKKVDAMVNMCRIGPVLSRVDNIVINELKPYYLPEEKKDFIVL